MLIRLIGPVEIVAGDRVQRFSAPKLACVLAALAVKPGEPVDVTTLIPRVWGQDPPDSAVGVLYSYMARLRGILRDVEAASIGRAGKRGYVLETDPDNIDIHKMRSLATQAAELSDNGALERALPIWRAAGELARGEALVGIEGNWAAELRARFRGERLQLLAGRYATELKLGNHATVVDEIAEAVAREPLAEPLAEHLMVALYRCGRTAEALDRYETTRVTLRDRLGTDPSPRLQRLHRRILNQDLATVTPSTAAAGPKPEPPAVPAQLPADTLGFLGREAEATAIYAAADRRRAVVVDGMAGVGKTALAVHAAHRLAPEYPDGQLFVDLRGYAEGVTPMAPEQALGGLLRSLNVAVPSGEAERSAALRTALAGRRMLLILDNARDATQVLPLLPGTDGCLTIITSRRRLVDLTEALPISLDTLPPADAARIFTTEAELDGGEEAVDRIAAACGNLPLALRIAASRLRTRPEWTVDHLLRRLTSATGTALRELDGAGRGVIAAFNLSYHELDGDIRKMFRLLAVFPGSAFDQHVAATLADVPPDDADRALEQLVDAHMLQPVAAGRYQLHDLLRKYATTVIGSQEKSEAWRRLAGHYIWMAWQSVGLVRPDTKSWTRLVKPGTPSGPVPSSFEEGVAWLNRELTVLLNLAKTAENLGEDEHLVDLVVPLQSHSMQDGHGGDVHVRLTNAALEAAERIGNIAACARLHKYIGSHHDDLGASELALSHLMRSLELWRSIGDDAGVARASYEVAVLRSRSGDSPQLIQDLLDAAESARRADAAAVEIHIRLTTSGRLGRLGRLDEAEDQLDLAERMVEATGDQRQRIRHKFYSAAICGRRKRFRDALNLYREVVDYSREHRIPDLLISGLYGTTEALLNLREYESASADAQEQLDLLQRWHFARSEAVAFTQLGRAQAGLGATDDAVDTLRGALALADQFDAGQHAAEARHALGELLAAEGDREEAVRLLTAAAEFFESRGYQQAEEVRLRLAELTAGT